MPTRIMPIRARSLVVATLFLGALLPAWAGPPPLSQPEGMNVQRDIAYADSKNPRQRLDLYLPKHREPKPRPLLVYIHGGGWRSGSKQRGRAWLRPYLKEGKFAGASIGYRLTDEAIWPAQLHDCKAAIRWLKAHADEYGYDPDRIAVIGSSAGGHLACLLGTTADCLDLEGKLGSHQDQDSRVRCVVNFFGPTAFLARDGKSSAFGGRGGRGSAGLLFGGAIDQHLDAVRQASSVTHASPGDASVLTLHGSLDPIVPYDQAVRIEEALKQVKVPVTTIQVQGARHGGFHQMPEVVKRVTVFLDHQLRGGRGKVSSRPIDATDLKPRRRRPPRPDAKRQ